jgi:hypothetical protein
MNNNYITSLENLEIFKTKITYHYIKNKNNNIIYLSPSLKLRRIIYKKYGILIIKNI